jgi:subtilase family serine protease
MEKSDKLIPIPGSQPVIDNAYSLEKVKPDEEVTFFFRLRGNLLSTEKTEFANYLGTLLPREKKHLSRDEMEKMHGMSEHDLEKIMFFINKNNIRIINMNRSFRLIECISTCSSIKSAFNVHLELFDRKGEKFRSHQGEIFIPYYLEGIVEGILGFDEEIKDYLQ